MGKDFPVKAQAHAPAASDATRATDALDMSREQVEALIENDPALVPQGASALMVESAVLDPEEVRALLATLDYPDAVDCESVRLIKQPDQTEEGHHEPHASPSRRRRGY